MYELMNVDNLNAADMTHLLSNLGGGNMLEGIRNVFTEGRNSERVKDILIGAGVGAGVITILGLCCWGIWKHKAKKQAKAEVTLEIVPETPEQTLETGCICNDDSLESECNEE